MSTSTAENLDLTKDKSTVPPVNLEKVQEVDITREKLNALMQAAGSRLDFKELHKAFNNSNGDEKTFLRNVEELVRNSHKHTPEQIYRLTGIKLSQE
jgi:hypothetical protein